MFKRFGLPDANRKWMHHFVGQEVDETENEVTEDSGYVLGCSRMRDTSEGNEEMVLLNPGNQVVEEPTESEVGEIPQNEIEPEPLTPLQKMQQKLDYLGISYGNLFICKGLFFDLFEEEENYIVRQLSIKYHFRAARMFSIPKESDLGAICWQFADRITFNVGVNDDGVLFFKRGVSINVAGVELFITEDYHLSIDPEDNPLMPLVEITESDYDRDKFIDDLCVIFDSQNKDETERNSKPAIEKFKYKCFGQLLYLNNKVYDLYINENDELCILQVYGIDGTLFNKLVAKANSDSVLYQSFRKHGVECIGSIIHYGGRHTQILVCDVDHNNSWNIKTFDGDENSCYYSFENEQRYLYAKSLNHPSTRDMIFSCHNGV